ncbi:GNAT family N-acetyltransferase [Lactovum miscens]|uniref:Putative GNAT family N-acyltransferase n=1 Tax=Lactovum miscens TaxID=190387 RepID=A0A841C732_9LACT|nr:GNAT family N-acetyltransferase [Lactovum miscens]MBB5888285.1 putative GNAT family N-acyltransferase [Lactovum miscens]
MKIKHTRDTMSKTYLDALKIRNEVFVKGQGIAYSLEVGSPIDEAMAVHFVLYNKHGKACGTCRLLNKHDETLLQRMAVLEGERKKGYASMLLTEAINFSREHRIPNIVLHAQLSARGFYEKFDFEPIGEVFEEAGIKHITMQLTL